MKLLPIRIAVSAAGFLFNLGLDRIDPDDEAEEAPVAHLPLPFGFERADSIDEFEAPDALGEVRPPLAAASRLAGDPPARPAPR